MAFTQKKFLKYYELNLPTVNILYTLQYSVVCSNVQYIRVHTDFVIFINFSDFLREQGENFEMMKLISFSLVASLLAISMAMEGEQVKVRVL